MDNEDFFAIAIMLFMPTAPIMAALNIGLHFKRAKVFVYEIICYILGISLNVWVVMGGWYNEPMPCMPAYILSPLAVAAYIYMKYTFDGNKFAVKSAKIISLICSVIFAAVVVYIWKPPLYALVVEKDISVEPVLAFYLTLVPINYIIGS